MNNHNSFLPPSLPCQRRQFWLALLLVVLAPAWPGLQAATLSWSGGTSGNWSDSANWGFAGVPANGDTLIFPGGKPNLTNTNNIAGLTTLNQICFAGSGGGYGIWGASFTLSTGIQATNTAGANTINNSIAMAVDQTVNVLSSGVSLTLAGTLSGAGGVIKSGLGTLTYQAGGSNTYTGATRVNTGLLQLNVSGTSAFGGALTIGDGSGSGSPTVRLLQRDEIGTSTVVTINHGGLFDLNGYNETIGTSLVLNDDAAVQTAAGMLTVADNATIAAGGSGSPSISGNLVLGATSCIFTSSPSETLLVNASVGGAGTITKNGAGGMRLLGSNYFSGTLTIQAGYVDVVNSHALGTAAGGTVINGTAILGIYGGVYISGEALTMNSAYSNGAIWVGSGSNTWTGSISLSADTTVNVFSGFSLECSGPISGSGDLTQLNPGTLKFSGTGANTYTGTTTVNAGTLLLAKTGSTGLGLTGSLVIGDGSSAATVRCLSSYQFWSYGKSVTINKSSLLDVAGNTEAIGPLTLQGGQLATGAGIIQFNNPITVLPSAVLSTISGQVFLAGSLVISNTAHLGSPDLRITATVTGGSTGTLLTKTGYGEVSLAASNSFACPVTVSGGSLWLENSYALGNTTTTATVNQGGTLLLYGNVAVGSKPLALSGSGWFNNLGALWATAGNSSWGGNITLASDTIINNDTSTGSLTLLGAVSGAGGITRIGTGTFQLFGVSGNTYTGNTFFQAGTNLLGKASGAAVPSGTLTIGDNLSSVAVVRDFNVGGNIAPAVAIRINNQGLLDLNGYNESLGSLTLDGATIQSGAGYLTMNADLVCTNSHGTSSSISGNVTLGSATRLFSTYGSLDVTANVSGAGGLSKNGLHALTLYGSNSYAGLTLVQEGILNVRTSWGLGSAAGGTVVSNGASLDLYPQTSPVPIAITNESLVLNGPGWAGLGALVADGFSSTCIWSGPITLNVGSSIEPWDPHTLLRIIGPINGAGGLTQIGAGVISLEGSSANTFAGSTTVSSGTMLLAKTTGDSTIPHNLDISGTVKLMAANQIADSADVTVQATGSLQVNGYYEWIDALSGSGGVDLGGNYLLVGANNGSSTFGGVISGTGTLYKYGPSSAITLTGANTYTGQTYVQYGTLLVNGSQPQSTAYVAGGILGGSGTVGNLYLPSGSGVVAPGPGILTCSNLTFTTAANTYRVDLTGPTPGTGYDQLNVRGTNNLGGATLALVPAFTSPATIGQQFVIINNDSTDPIVGTFNGLPQGTNFSVGGYRFQISYTGGSGNDVVLTLLDVPAASSASAVTTGNGNHALDPNECNLLDIVITNKSGAPMTGLSAVLSANTPNVMISQPYSAYPDAPANGQRTNVTSFQIATLPSFACGTDINLQLAVNSTTHGEFILPVVLHSGETANSPVRFDNSIVTNVPDTGAIESTNVVASWSGGPVTKVAVSLWLGAPIDSDLALTLIAPDGTSVELSSGNGAGANFGSGSADANRTTFDDSALTAITAGAAPFIGAYRPEASLASLSHTTPLGNWRLRIQDTGFYGSPDTLRAWTLFLYGTTCSAGGGYCDVCLAPISGVITSAGLVQVNRWNRNNVVNSCGAPKTWGGLGAVGDFHYEVYTFTNTTGADACVTVELTSTSDVMAAAYLDSFNPADITANYLGDAGDSTSSRGGVTAFSFTAPAGARFQVAVNEVLSYAGTLPYTLLLSGLPCPAPVVSAQPLPGNQVHVSWPTWAAGYQLEGKLTLAPGAWTPSAREPIVSSGAYNITNSSTPGWFYRLRKP